MLTHYVIMVLILLGSNLLIYNLGYRKGAKRVLNAWKEVTYANIFEEAD